jgi:uncharacterized protein YkwD
MMGKDGGTASAVTFCRLSSKNRVMRLEPSHDLSRGLRPKPHATAYLLASVLHFFSPRWTVSYQGCVIMVGKSWGAWLLAALILTGAPANGQSIKEVQSESLERRPGNFTTARNSPDLARVKEDILSSTNQFRRQHGRQDLQVNQKFAEAAQYLADYMARTDKYSHTADGKEPWERAAQYGYAYCIVLENIAYEFSAEGFRTNDLAQQFMKGWEQSPPHRKNLLDPDVYDIGVGLAYSSRTGRYYAVQDFGRPKSKEIVFKITNSSDSLVKYTIDGKEFSIDPGYTITYEHCRPPQVRFPLPDPQSSARTENITLQPRNGGHYVIRKDKSGHIKVEQG